MKIKENKEKNNTQNIHHYIRSTFPNYNKLIFYPFRLWWKTPVTNLMKHVIIHNFTLLCLELKILSPDDETRAVRFNFNSSLLFPPAHNYYKNNTL